LGGSISGIISLIPIINLFNILFMMWMGVGGFIAVFLLKKENQRIKIVDSAFIGALSGMTGGIIFGLFTTLMVLNISQEKIEAMFAQFERYTSLLNEDMLTLLQEINLKAAFFTIIAIALIFSLFSGSIGGMISRAFFFPRNEKKERQS
jgi:hypothetical protein